MQGVGFSSLPHPTFAHEDRLESDNDARPLGIDGGPKNFKLINVGYFYLRCDLIIFVVSAGLQVVFKGRRKKSDQLSYF